MCPVRFSAPPPPPPPTTRPPPSFAPARTLALAQVLGVGFLRELRRSAGDADVAQRNGARAEESLFGLSRAGHGGVGRAGRCEFNGFGTRLARQRTERDRGRGGRRRLKKVAPILGCGS